MQSRGDSGPASEQHGDVHADLRRRRFDYADRLFRDQRALDRHRRHHAALQRHFHGRLATAFDQALVERRADSRSLSDHRKQHALSGRAARRHRGAARGLLSRPRPYASPGRQVRRRDLFRRGENHARSERSGGAGAVSARFPTANTATKRFSTTTASRTNRCRSASKSSSPATK